MMALAPALAATFAAGVAGLAATKGRARLRLSRAKHGSLTGHVRWGQRIARQIAFYDYDDARFFAADDAPADIAAKRRAGFERLSALYATRFAKTVAATKALREGLSDLQFTGRYRVPFQFSAKVRDTLATGAFYQSSSGVTVTDLDGNVFYDLAGSYGVNLFGHDFYKDCIAQGAARVADLGPVLGTYHPVIAANVDRLRAISGMDEVSFHMSGTEAVMQAVRLARYHTGRRRVVRFAGAYHGWWGDVQPGIGNPTPADNTLTLSEMSDRTLHVLATRKDIACVLVNPLQAMHPNKGAPSDGTLVDSSRSARLDRAAYRDWLVKLRDVCTQAGVVLIFDEVFMGFRLAKCGMAEAFGVRPDMVTYGKTLGGGLPIGVVCGRAELMKRFRPEAPADICFARGTFNAHPYVMGAMDVFLERLDSPQVQAMYEDVDARWDARLARFNEAMAEADLPVRAAGMQTVWTILYTVPSRYNWLLQYYARAEGLALSWVGTGRLIFSLNYDDAAFAEVVARFVKAAQAMQQDGWWWTAPGTTNKMLRRQVLKETLARRLGRG
ncbi:MULTISPECIES: aminotransferase class III-fold pyridoxal phosphate-dependent enzyme [Sphingomonas]|jgi:glutamate-1-semialdehyde 2,1-aminomutase|uniref:Glutamate-1-semialdehyde 2,1-aminomutase n=1 Tax=Sphingomonas hankookensis TaxID=563996 RepID=A0ABR5YBR9_9SPHN|nr:MULTISPECIES: aminotransferase class III-fold pyridoxal phosphate-dependent enzyme [Sphingomonas]KZE11414.1 glutamate-1-semialdehyde 2,1-aminomutase [Sphingomonas hankookensis]PZT92540.1 MAG: glutamate-1-semialdehyde 2,1-aminomutase [Sphingomonas sp.]WCP72099.1 aminotransferase class III-fold pyridoxal phosphate-dependent enzyme [Sphingomonas hankookensis]